MRRSLVLASIVIVVAIVLALLLFGALLVSTFPTHLSRLHAPHLRYLSALTNLLDQGGVSRIEAVFKQQGSSEPQVLTYYQNNLEVTGMDGRGDRLIPTDGACAGYGVLDAAVSPDGLWAVCVFLPYPSTIGTPFYLDLVSLRPHGPPVHHAFALGMGQPGSTMAPVWSPDGRYVAVGEGCGVEIFAVSVDTSQLSLVGSFTSDALDFYNSCAASGLSWSPDSMHLRLGVNRSWQGYALDDHIPLAQVLAGQGATVQIPGADFGPFSDAQVWFGPIWRPGKNAAVVMVNGTNGLLNYTGLDQPPQVLLTLPDGAHQVQSALWTPDGRQLVITIGSGPCVDHCPHVIPDVYLLTPTLST